VRVRLSDASATAALLEHLALQGFPSTYLRRDEIDVLFPGSPSLFALAAELDLWRAGHPGVTLRYDGAPSPKRTSSSVEAAARTRSPRRTWRAP
jgi:hypothetical protein